MWFRRDLRLADNPALVEACADDATLPLFVLDPALWGPAGIPRKAYLAASLRSLDAALARVLDGRLQVVRGDPVRRVVAAAREVGASRVHVAADFGPYGRRRDDAVAGALGRHGIELVRTGSSYAVSPGRLRTGSGDPYRVYTPFSRAWADHDWRAPIGVPDSPPDSPPDSCAAWLTLKETAEIADPRLPEGIELPEAGEAAAGRRWKRFLEDRVAGYDTDRDRPDRNGTSHMSVHLKWGEIHPRTMLADLPPLRSTGAATYRKELAWREFYADVLFHRPETAREYLRGEFARMAYDEPDGRLAAWQQGRTGFPIVDAGMRRRTSGSSTRPPRAAGSTRTARTCGAGSPSWPRPGIRTSPVRPRATPPRSSTMPRRGARHWSGGR